MTDHVSLGWASLVGAQRTLVVRPGIMKRISQTSTGKPKNSVLFWRNAGYSNGADLAIQSFRNLAPRHPNVRFVFAVRPQDRYEQELLQLAQAVENIDVHVYPYVEGISLARLFSEALFVVQPFRQLSINPQTSILETLYAGVPVIATDIESNREVIQQERNGLLIPPGDERALSSGIEGLLKDAGLLAELTRNARPMTESRWNWDSFRRQLLQVYIDVGNADGTKSCHGV
jgi:glycosyltransferase involved in cell wall biosynthesis